MERGYLSGALERGFLLRYYAKCNEGRRRRTSATAAIQSPRSKSSEAAGAPRPELGEAAKEKEHVHATPLVNGVILFVDTDIGTCLGLWVAADSTLGHLKSHLAMEHAKIFPDRGAVSVKSFCFHTKKKMFHLLDTMLLCHVLSRSKERYFLHAKMQVAAADAHDRGISGEGCLAIDRSAAIPETKSGVLPQGLQGVDSSNNQAGLKLATLEQIHAFDDRSQQKGCEKDSSNNDTCVVEASNMEKGSEKNTVLEMIHATSSTSKEVKLKKAKKVTSVGNNVAISDIASTQENPDADGKKKKKRRHHSESKKNHRSEDIAVASVFATDGSAIQYTTDDTVYAKKIAAFTISEATITEYKKRDERLVESTEVVRQEVPAENKDGSFRRVEGKRKPDMQSEVACSTEPNDSLEFHLHTNKNNVTGHSGIPSTGAPSTSPEFMNKTDGNVRKDKRKRKTKINSDLTKPVSEQKNPNGDHKDTDNGTQGSMCSIAQKVRTEPDNGEENNDMLQETEDVTCESTLKKKLKKNMFHAVSQNDSPIDATKSKEQSKRTKHHARTRNHDGSVSGMTSSNPNVVSNSVKSFPMGPVALAEHTEGMPHRRRVAVGKVSRSYNQVNEKTKKYSSKNVTGAIFSDAIVEGSDDAYMTSEKAAIETPSRFVDSGTSYAALDGGHGADDVCIAPLSKKGVKERMHIGSSILRDSNNSYKEASQSQTEQFDDTVTEVADSEGETQ